MMRRNTAARRASDGGSLPRDWATIRAVFERGGRPLNANQCN
jgi:hypothetical protein